MWRTPEDHKVSVLMRYLGGESKRELLVMDKRDRVEELFWLLESIYGEKIPLTTLLKKFYARNQLKSEGVHNYCQTLRELVYKIKQAAPDRLSDKVIRDNAMQSPYIKY